MDALYKIGVVSSTVKNIMWHKRHREKQNKVLPKTNKKNPNLLFLYMFLGVTNALNCIKYSSDMILNLVFEVFSVTVFFFSWPNFY